MSLTSYQAAPPRVSNMSIQGTKANPKNDCRCTIACKEALAATNCVGKIYAARFERGKQTFQRSSVVERSAVNRLVVGSNPTAGANAPIEDEAHLPRNARGEEARLREKPQEPAKIKAVGPIGNGDLVAHNEKSERRANAMNDRPITQPLYYYTTSELFLRPAANADQHMRRQRFQTFPETSMRPAGHSVAKFHP